MLGIVAEDTSFSKRNITDDETCVYKYEVETFQESSEWCTKNMPKLKKAIFTEDIDKINVDMLALAQEHILKAII